MLDELPENDARGELATIYTELRDLCAIPYVSSMQRHLATRAGWLEWAWNGVRPAFVTGAAQTAGWAAATNALERVAPPALPPLEKSDLTPLGVDAEGTSEIANICRAFVRVSPLNLMFSGLVRRHLSAPSPSAAPRSSSTVDSWTPPAMLSALPALAPFETLNLRVRAALSRFETEVAGVPFIPGLYRMFATWPGFLDYLAEHLSPRLGDPETGVACDQIEVAIDQAVPAVYANLDWDVAPPDLSEVPSILDAIARYRVTSPQMVIYSSLILGVLPRSPG